ncbi:hypothetical protein MMYC01_203408 [Madurella mycetomatis]|uniref:Uncharacterized protein n=1 Tax=Madurella mycetomatis TaxID=100816 RepID=A0A175WA06_9PEZI|nr:hypothetical protein MMYC01_203408 [Madurella mycetomatis]
MSSLFFIKTIRPESEKVEVHVTKPGDGYKQPAGQYVSGYSPTDRDNGVFCIGPEGLYLVKTRNVGSGKIEVHRTTTSSNYSDFDIHTATVFELKDTDNGTWTVDGADLFLIKTRRCESRLIEVHRANGNAFSAFSLHAAVPIPQSEGENGAWDMENGSLYFIRYRNTQGNNVEVWRAHGDGLQNVERYTTWFSTSDGDKGSWRIGANGDLYFIKTRNTGSGMIEVHVASSQSGYQEVAHHATWISQDDGPFGTYLVA